MIRKLRVAVLVLLVVLGVSSVSGMPLMQKEWWFYADQNALQNGDPCGYMFEFCTGTRWSGCQTAYYEVYDLGTCYFY